jgi:DNA-binding CsgD family transcriptional regulator
MRLRLNLTQEWYDRVPLEDDAMPVAAGLPHRIGEMLDEPGGEGTAAQEPTIQVALTLREARVLETVTTADSLTDVAARLGVSRRTVEDTLDAIRRKIDAGQAARDPVPA